MADVVTHVDKMKRASGLTDNAIDEIYRAQLLNPRNVLQVRVERSRFSDAGVFCNTFETLESCKP